VKAAPSDDTGGAPDAYLEPVKRVLDDILEARTPQPISEDGCAPQALPLVRSANRLVRFMEELAAFVLPLTRGELSAPLPSRDNAMAAPFTELHSRLSELTWQAGQVAHGDYSQRIDFMGEFSIAFNSMVELLEEREQGLKTEIAGRQQAEEILQHERDLLVAGPLVTFRWQAGDDGVVEYVSPNITAFGYDAEEFVSGRRTYSSIVHPEDLERIVADGDTKTAAGVEWWTQEYRIIAGDGETRWIRDYTHLVLNADGELYGYEGYIIDITAQKAAEAALRRREEQLRMLSLADDLTGLYNRRGLFALGEHAMRSARRHKSGLNVLFLDVDSLKKINDRFGHGEGDQALRDIAAVLRGAIRESDVVARAGGDEFVVLVEDKPQAARELARRLERRIAAADAKGDHRYKLAVSMGMVFWPPDEKATLQELIERADELMYTAKHAKRDAATG
jgi:diguanylate cyclase (GGDEF)-like protein/PAS domain S-box-containing protein